MRLTISSSWIGSKLPPVPELPALEDDFDEEPVESGAFSFGDFQLVGHGEVTNVFCGKWIRARGFKGCIRVDLHDKITLDGKSYKGKVFVRKVHHWCHKPSCPVCFKSGWAVRQAGRIEGRLAEASKRFGQVEHIVCSVPVSDYGLDFDALYVKARKVLSARGIIGGAMIFHGMRFNWDKFWYWSPHFHVLGYILGGYRRCRRCRGRGVSPSVQACSGCGGFEDRTRKLHAVDGYIVKVLGKRKTVFGTAWYQLNHSTIDVTKKRFHVVRWFGVVSYRKLKVTVEKREELCPCCQHELVWLRYFGSKSFVTDRSSPDYERDAFEDFEEDGQRVWVEKESKRYW